MRLADFDYDLPETLIAQHPPATRSGSRLLRVSKSATLHDDVFAALPAQIAPGTLMVFNDTRVLRARLMGKKPSGGQVECLIERVLADDHAVGFLRTSHTPRAGAVLHFGPARVVVSGREDDLFVLHLLDGVADFHTLMATHGVLPLPPYIQHAAAPDDDSRYQTVYAQVPGAVAAPTAGLHFDAALLDVLDARGVERVTVTLHVGAGTFQPVRVDDLSAHRMHRERYQISTATADAIRRARAAGRPVMAVGTTSLRALEAAAQSDGEVRAGEGETDLFITPGYPFRVVDRLLTNFHLPKSTLLMLVSAFAGMDTIRNAYLHAIAQRYRFFSYGDAMLLERQHAV